MNKKLLIVEDSQLVGERLATVFSALPALEVTLAASIGMAAARFAEQQPDIVILDIQLPDGNGMELLDRIKRRHPWTTVLMFSNHPDLGRQCRAAGADGFFDKATDFEMLVATVTTLARPLPGRAAGS